MSSIDITPTSDGDDLVEELKAQLRKAEAACEQYRKELSTLQLRLNDALGGAGSAHSRTVSSAHLESTLDAENSKEGESVVGEEELLHTVVPVPDLAIHRRSVERENDMGSRSDKVDSRGRSSTIQRKSLNSPPNHDDAPNPESLLIEKDKIIEELKIELQESHSRRAEVENTTSQQIRDLEKSLLDAQSTHVTTTESKPSVSSRSSENVLSRSTRNGHEVKNDTHFEAEIKTLRDQNNSLTLYVNRIVTRLLQHGAFEDIFQNTSADQDLPVNTMKELQRVDAALGSLRDVDHVDAKQEARPPPQSLLSRAGSIFSTKTRSRPNSVPADEDRHTSATTPAAQAINENMTKPISDVIPPPRLASNPNEDPATSISIPLRRADSRRRPAPPGLNSERRGPPSSNSRPPSDQASPGGPRRTSYFGSSATSTANVAPKDTAMSSALDGRLDVYNSSRSASDSAYTVDAPPPTTPSKQTTSSISETQTDESITHHSNSPRSISAASSTSGDRPPTILTSNIGTGTGTVFTSASNRMRPLRLVQERQEADDAALAERKKANRSSWVGGWFTGSNTGGVSGSGSGFAVGGAGTGVGVGSGKPESMQTFGAASSHRISAQSSAPRGGSPGLGD